MKKLLLSSILLLIFSLFGLAQTGVIKGKITDSKTNESLIGTTVLIQGTTQGTITNFDGDFLIPKVNPGTYNLVVSFISYESKVVRVEVTNDEETEINVALDPATLDIGEVQVTAKRRTDTDMAMLSSLKSQNLIVSGISAQQISRSQDKDAAEVIRRVPGITITDGRFVIVRGLIERYNSVMLNGATAPSFEADKRAFSFDAIPSGLINNILIYKSPSPELPADFAGAATNVETKSVADENSLVISYGTKYVQHTSFSDDFQTYKGSKTDWLGYDNGVRSIPQGVPPSEGFADLYKWESQDDFLQKAPEITRISKLFSNNWTTQSKKPFLDQSFSFVSQQRFLIGRASIGNITALNYQFSSEYQTRERNEYQHYDEETGVLTPDFLFNDRRSSQSAKFGVIHNWNIIYGKNQKLEIRNFFNNNGTTTTNLREGLNNYSKEYLRLNDLKFVRRTVYSGQLAGEQIFNKERTKVNWMVGYGLTNSDQPDNRRTTYVLNETESSPNYNRYYAKIQNQTNPYLSGRLWLNMNERIYDYKVDLEHNFHLFSSEKTWKIKFGGLYERKFREFGSRLIGVVALGTPPVDLYDPIEVIMDKENFYIDETRPYQHGLSYNDYTRKKDSYNAHDILQAGYLSLSIPITGKININGGVRVEKFNRLITDFYEPTPTPELFDIVRDTVDFFPSVNVTYNITNKHVLRASYGKTINRPEFREMSNFDYQDFEMFALVHGTDTLDNAYIQNYDVRYEWYPNPGEIVSIGAFYKQFENPIEVFLISAGTGYDYKPDNAREGNSLGVELDIRKTLTEFENSGSFLRNLKDITLIFNTSLIKSKLNTKDNKDSREESRVMQGQSPYIVNLGINYSGENNGLAVSLSYNRIGKRIAYVGTKDNPHTWELPRNSLDLTVQKDISERFSAKIGIKNIIKDPVRFVQYYGSDESLELNTLKYFPNRSVAFSLVYRL